MTTLTSGLACTLFLLLLIRKAAKVVTLTGIVKLATQSNTLKTDTDTQDHLKSSMLLKQGLTHRHAIAAIKLTSALTATRRTNNGK
jgi:hypothetical protein